MLLSGNGANLGCDATFSPSFSPSYSAFIYRGISPIGEAENKPRMAALKSEIARLLLQLDNSCAPTRECDPDTSPVCVALLPLLSSSFFSLPFLRLLSSRSFFLFIPQHLVSLSLSRAVFPAFIFYSCQPLGLDSTTETREPAFLFLILVKACLSFPLLFSFLRTNE